MALLLIQVELFLLQLTIIHKLCPFFFYFAILISIPSMKNTIMENEYVIFFQFQRKLDLLKITVMSICLGKVALWRAGQWWLGKAEVRHYVQCCVFRIIQFTVWSGLWSNNSYGFLICYFSCNGFWTAYAQ